MPISIHRGWDVQLDASNEESDDREGCTVQLNARPYVASLFVDLTSLMR